MTPLAAFLARHPASIHVSVTSARGSTPREAGAFMLVSADALHGTIGGGQLEFMAIDHARAMLANADMPETLDIPLGPEIGQCCGGRVGLRFRAVDRTLADALLHEEEKERAADPDIFLFGAGHVGLALAAALSPLPFRTTIIETRETDARDLPPGATFRQVAMPEAEVAKVRPGGAVVILTHDHALDFLIAREALARTDLAYVGMIGSATKKVVFRNWLAEEGGTADEFDRLILPIGGSVVRDKRPAVIAAMVSAELLAVLSGRN